MRPPIAIKALNHTLKDDIVVADRSQPAGSLQIRELERRLGVRLI